MQHRTAHGRPSTSHMPCPNVFFVPIGETGETCTIAVCFLVPIRFFFTSISLIQIDLRPACVFDASPAGSLESGIFQDFFGLDVFQGGLVCNGFVPGRVNFFGGVCFFWIVVGHSETSRFWH